MRIATLHLLLVAAAFGQAPPNSPQFQASDILNTATLSTAVSPGTVILIRGVRLSADEAEAGVAPLPDTLAATQVLVDGRAIPLISVSPEEIVAQLPWDIAAGQRSYVVRSGRLESLRVTAPVLRAAPGIITTDGVKAFFQNAEGTLNDDDAPARSGSTGILYAVGLGPVDTRIPAGSANPTGKPTLAVSVDIGGVRVDQVTAELMSGLLGVYRIQMRVPAIGYGAFPARITVDGNLSNRAEIVILPTTTAINPNAAICSRAILGRRGLQLPIDASDVVVEDEMEETGYVHSLYPNLSTGDERFYQDLRTDRNGCPLTVETGLVPDLPAETDGGDIPPVEEIENWVAESEKFIATAIDGLPTTQPGGQIVRIVPPGFVYERPQDLCRAGQPITPFCRSLSASPFSGKDIIYVHGFDEGLLKQLVLGATYPRWTSTTIGTYISTFLPHGADMWEPQIANFLRTKSAKNRYLTVGWSTAERLEYAVNATLYQIADAMRTGARVQRVDATDPRGTSGFCARGCVIITHSTAGMLVDVAMAKAMDAGYRSQVGEIQFIPANITTHVAIAAAFNGSGLASAAITAAGAKVPQWGPICDVINRVFDLTPGGPCGTGAWMNSVLIDLLPKYAESVWRPWVSRTPVPVLTVSGTAERDKYSYFLNPFLHPGFDDRVVTTDSSCARTNLRVNSPAGTLPRLIPSQWDRGMYQDDDLRSLRFWREQMLRPSFQPQVSSSGCTPYKTPWGMIFSPIGLRVGGPDTFLPNHYSFLQTTEFHRATRDLSEVEKEDVRAVKDNTVYAQNLVHTDLRILQTEAVRGRKITFRVFGKRHTWYVWRRTYHRLKDWETQPSAYWIYNYVR